MNFIFDKDATAGEVILNFCDPTFFHLGSSQEAISASMYLRQLAGYLLYAERIIVPSRFLRNGGPLFTVVEWIPELLEEGLLVPDIREGETSFESFIRQRTNQQEEIDIAIYLDHHCKYVSVFKDSDQSARYHMHLMEDTSPSGALRGLMDDTYHFRLNVLHEEFFSCSGSRKKFSRLAQKIIPEKAILLDQWAAMRYYTTPMELDPTRTRDMPLVASRLYEYAQSKTPYFVEIEEENAALTPMRQFVTSSNHAMPKIQNAHEAQQLFSAVMFVRDNVPEAQSKFGDIVERTKLDGISYNLNEVFKEAWFSEYSKTHKQLSLDVRMRKSMSDQWKDIFVSFMLSITSGFVGDAVKAGKDIYDTKRLVRQEHEFETQQRYNKALNNAYSTAVSHLKDCI
jgi:hypothetical protein